MELVKKIFIKLGSLDRRFIFLIVGLSVLMPLLQPEWFSLPIRPKPHSQIVYNEINKLLHELLPHLNITSATKICELLNQIVVDIRRQ